MTNQEAIETIKEAMFAIDSDAHFHFEYAAAADMAIEALEKQIPKTPIKQGFYYCENCGKTVTITYKYCRECGQALDWSDMK